MRCALRPISQANGQRGNCRGLPIGGRVRPILRSRTILNPPSDLRYTATHEWVRPQADGLATVGITDFAQDHLGELVYVELPDVGRALAQGEACAVVESTKAASDVYSPVAGLVVEVNAQLAAAPQTVNESPFDAGWLFRVRLSDPSQADALMDAAAYGNAAASQG